MSNYRSPILCSVYKLLAALAGVGSIISLLVGVGGDNTVAKAGAFGAFFTCIVAAILLYGVAEVIDLIGKTAYNTGATADNTDAMMRTLVAVHSEIKRENAGGESPDSFAELSRDLKGLRGQIDNIEGGPLAQLGWLGEIARNTGRE